jgi:hypothetical protein
MLFGCGYVVLSIAESVDFRIAIWKYGTLAILLHEFDEQTQIYLREVQEGKQGDQAMKARIEFDKTLGHLQLAS